MINVTKLTVKVRFPNLFVSILNARHFEKPILRDSMSNIQKTITKIGKTNNTIAKKIVTFLYHLSLSAFSWLLSYLCLLRGFICVYKIHLYSLLSENLRMLIKNPISYFHIGTFLLSGKKVIFWNTGKQKLSCGISLFFTGLSGTVCRGREVFFCGGAWLMKCIYRGIKNNENVRSR